MILDMIEKVIEKVITHIQAQSRSRNGRDDRSDRSSVQCSLAIVLSVGAFGRAVLQTTAGEP